MILLNLLEIIWLVAVFTVIPIALEECIIEGEELLARAICHELDHLDGHLYVEKVEGELMDVTYDEDEEDVEE